MTDKKALRQRLKARRAEVSAEERKQTDEAIVEMILASPQYRNADAILLYAPVRGEVDLIPLARRARAEGKLVAFPRCDAEGHTMHFYTLSPESRLAPGAYGIPEPPADAPACPISERTLCLVPALSYDLAGNRIGYGGGYYDRFLATFEGFSAGVLPRRMLLRQIPTEEHDRAVDLIFCERGIIKPTAVRAVVPSEAQESPAMERDSVSVSVEPVAQAGRLASLISRIRAFLEEKDGTRPLHAPPALVALIFVLLVLSRLIDTLISTRSNAFLMVILAQLLVFGVPAFFYATWKGEGFLRRLRPRLFRPSQSWFLLCILVVMITGSLLCCILTGGIRSLQGSFTLYSTFVARPGTGGWRILLVILAYGILPAFFEEAIFRSLLCAEYERYGVPVAIVASTLFFALLHFSFPLFLSYLFLGAILALTLYTTRSFFAVFLLHLCYNLFCIFGQPYLSAFYVRAGKNEIFLFCLITLLLLFAAFAAGEARKIYHHYAKSNLDSSYTGARTLKGTLRGLIKAMFSPAVIPCAVIWLVMAIVNLF